MCWYATRRGQSTVKRPVCAAPIAAAKSANDSLADESGHGPSDVAGEGLRMNSISYSAMSARRIWAKRHWVLDIHSHACRGRGRTYICHGARPP